MIYELRDYTLHVMTSMPSTDVVDVFGDVCGERLTSIVSGVIFGRKWGRMPYDGMNSVHIFDFENGGVYTKENSDRKGMVLGGRAEVARMNISNSLGLNLEDIRTGISLKPETIRWMFDNYVEPDFKDQLVFHLCPEWFSVDEKISRVEPVGIYDSKRKVVDAELLERIKSKFPKETVEVA
jgi:hypothetical protein